MSHNQPEESKLGPSNPSQEKATEEVKHDSTEEAKHDATEEAKHDATEEQKRPSQVEEENKSLANARVFGRKVSSTM